MDQTDLKRIDDLIHDGEGRFTITEAASSSGLAVDTVKDALEELLNKYVCRLAVTENGDLIYDFGRPPVRKDRKTLREYFEILASFILKVLAILYRILIAAVLVVYFVLFLIIMIVIVIAAFTKGGSSSSEKNSGSSGSGSSRSSGSSGFGSVLAPLRAIGRMFLDIFDWRTVSGGYYYTEDDLGYRYRHAESKKSRLKSDKKNFVASVYDFVFGPPRFPMDPLANEKEVAQFLRENKGLIVPADLMALAGWTAKRAREFFTDCLIRFRGEVKVSENGVVYGEFDQIIRGDFGLKDGEVIYYWDEYEPDYELTGNDGIANFKIVFFNAFNLIFSFLVVTDLMENIVSWAIRGREEDLISVFLEIFASLLYADQPFVMTWMGWFPLAFSTVFFTIPLIRWIGIKKAKEKRHRNNVLKRFYRIILNTNRGNPMTVDKVAREFVAIEKKEHGLNYEQMCLMKSMAGEKPVEKDDPLTREQIETIMNELALDLQGDTDISESGELVFLFPRIQAELAEIGEIRQRKKVDGDLGKVVAESFAV